MIKIREAINEDKKGIEEVNKSAISTLRKTYRPNNKALKNKSKLATRLNRIVATMNHAIIGTVEYEIKGNTLSIIGLDVHEQYRRNGVARKLVDYLTNIGKRNSIPFLSLHTIKETGNVSIFEKLGFFVTSETIDQFSVSDKFESLTDVKMQMLCAEQVAGVDRGY